MEELKKTNTNEICNSTCEVKIDCPNMWSLVQYNSIYSLRKNSMFSNKLSFEFEDSDPQKRIKMIAQLYAKMYLEKFDFSKPAQQGRFYWIALGAFAAKQVYCGILALDDLVSKYGHKLLPDTAYTKDFKQLSSEDFKYVRVRMLKGNLWLFLDIFPFHEYYCKYPNSFQQCLSLRNIQTYHPKIKEMIGKLPYAPKAMSQVKHFNYGADLKYIKQGFQFIKAYENANSIKSKQTCQNKSLLIIAEHEQRVVLQSCFYAPEGKIDTRLKRIFDIQMQLENNYPTLLSAVGYVADMQGREACLSHTCQLPRSLKSHPYKDKFRIKMEKDEKLYDVKSRMIFIRRIAKEFHFLMINASSDMKRFLLNIANGNIKSGGGGLND